MGTTEGAVQLQVAVLLRGLAGRAPVCSHPHLAAPRPGEPGACPGIRVCRRQRSSESPCRCPHLAPSGTKAMGDVRGCPAETGRGPQEARLFHVLPRPRDGPLPQLRARVTPPRGAREGHTPQAPHLTGALAPSPRALDFRRQRGCCWPPTPTFWLEAAGKGWIQRGGRYITAGLTPGAHPTPRLDGSVSGGGAVTCPPSAGWWVPPPPWVAQGSGFLQSPGQEGLAT